jgi:hypothetical protein
MGGGEAAEEEVAKRAATKIPYNSPCKIVAERPKLVNEPLKEEVEDAEAKVTERGTRGEAGEGVMEASEAMRGEEGERWGSVVSGANERRSCSAWVWRTRGGMEREGKL